MIDQPGPYKVIKVNDGQRIYFQVRREDVIYPPLPGKAVTTCMDYGILTAEAAVKLRDELTSQLRGQS